MNPTTSTDAYKVTHWLQRPYGLTSFYNYGEARKGGEHDYILYFGMQYILKKYFMTKVTSENIEKGRRRALNTFGTDKYFPTEIWKKIRDLGYYPLRIKAVKEGTLVPTSNVCFTMEATKDWFAPMVSHFENWLMWHWYSTGVATRMFYVKKHILPYFEKSMEVPFLDFAVNDFGYRGGSFHEAASIGGAAHLISFNGTDNLSACDLIEDYYNYSEAGNSVWATEHSVATVWGSGEGEYDYIKAQLQRSEQHLPISIVIDSYDADNFMYNVVTRPDVKKLIIERPGRVIFRPDSNDPLINMLKYTDVLAANFGFHINRKNYKILNENIGLIQGDGMNKQSIPELYKMYTNSGWSAENFNTGSGGGILEEDLTRDTDRWAIKVSYAEIDGVPVNVSKTPQSDLSKSSKPGKLKLHYSHGHFNTFSSADNSKIMFNAYIDSLETVYENGNLLRDENFLDIRKRANSFL